jgi:hypothetical protein
MFVPGKLYRRTELHDQFGGQRQGGISTPAKHPYIFLITGDSGEQYGYRDEWSADGHFLYTGEGQKGNMRFVHGNKAIRDHAQEGKSLHLFEHGAADPRFLRYIGEVEHVDHVTRMGPDVDGYLRELIIFKLRPVGSLVPDSAALEAALAPEITSGSRSGAGFGSPENNRRVEKAAIDFVKKHYETQGWRVASVEAQKLGYDLLCMSDEAEEHVEVKGIQGTECCFIITAGEIRNALMDRKHVTCVVTGALSGSPTLVRLSSDALMGEFEHHPLAFRLVPKSKPEKR